MLKTPSRAACTLLIAIALLVATTMFTQQLSGQTSNDEKTTELVCKMIQRFHISRREINDEVSAMVWDRFMKVLDPQKLYFTQADVDSMQGDRLKLDDQLQTGNVDFAYAAFDRYLKRAEQQITLAGKLIDAPHDFTLDESMVIDADTLAWAKDQTELNDRWRKRIKFELLNLTLSDAPKDPKNVKTPPEQLHSRYRNLLRAVQGTEDIEKLETYLSAVTHCFDPHSSYMSPRTLEEFRIAMELSLEGIGAALRSEDGYTIVAQIVPGGAAEEDGRLKIGDKIVGVAQDDEAPVDIVEMKLSKVVQLIRGKKGTHVKLQVVTADTSESVTYELTRRKIELKSQEVKGEVISDERTKGARIGVINIPSFYRDFRGAQRGDDDFKSTVRDLQTTLLGMRDKVDAVVVDLRFNGGGALSEAIEVSGLFLDHGPVVQVKKQNGEIETHDDDVPRAAYGGPLVVVCNRLSASASEIFAGVIKDYGRGLIVGDSTTHGKGTVQNVMPVSNELFSFNREKRGALKLTINQFYRVNGDSTQNRGVQSDVVLPSLLEHMDVGEANLENALKFDHVAPANFESVDMLNADIISATKDASQRRVANDPKFRELQASIDRYLSRKSRKTVSLNEDVLRKERDEEKKEQTASAEEPDPENPTAGPVLPANFYNDEVLNITLDYLALLRKAVTAQK